MKRILLSLLLLPPFFAQAIGEMSRPKLSDLQVSFNQLIKKNPQQNEDRLCGILRQISDDPIARKPQVIEWLDVAYARLDAALGRAALCSRMPAATVPARAPEAGPLEEPLPEPIPSAREISKPTPISTITPSVPSVPKPAQIPMPSAPEMGKTPLPTMPSAPSSAPEAAIKEPLEMPMIEKQKEIQIPEIPLIFNAINNVVTKNKFINREQWPHDDQQQVEALMRAAQEDRNLNTLLHAYFKDYTTIQKRPRLALQTEQTVNFLYGKPVNDSAVKKHKENLEKIGATNTAQALEDWLNTLPKEQAEEKEKEAHDIIEVPKTLSLEPHELSLEQIKAEGPEKKKEIDEINKWKLEFQIAGNDPQVLKNMLEEFKKTSINYATVEKEQLKQEMIKKLKELKNLTDQQIIDEIFNYLIEQDNRVGAYTLIRILENAERDNNALEQQRELIQVAALSGAGQIYNLLDTFKKQADIGTSRRKFPNELHGGSISNEQKKIRRK